MPNILLILYRRDSSEQWQRGELTDEATAKATAENLALKYGEVHLFRGEFIVKHGPVDPGGVFKKMKG